MISVRGLTHRYGEQTVLSGIDLDVAAGEILAIMGSSGGGKTTLLRCMSGLIVPTEGKIEVDGIDVVAEPERAREKIGLVFQSAALFDYMNVEDNLLFGVRRKRRIGKGDERRLVDDLLGTVALEGAAKKMPSELSGGMRKRVGLARALAMQPKALLYDEPTSGLDPITAYAIDGLIVETRDRLGIASVVVSHDVSSVFRVADRIAFLSRGRLVFVGEVDAFRASRDAEIQELVQKAQAETFGAE